MTYEEASYLSFDQKWRAVRITTTNGKVSMVETILLDGNVAVARFGPNGEKISDGLALAYERLIQAHSDLIGAAS